MESTSVQVANVNLIYNQLSSFHERSTLIVSLVHVDMFKSN